MIDDEFLKQRTLPDLGSAADVRSSTLPHKIGPYPIKSLLNKGGMSYLYLGTHPTTAQPIVIKVLSPKYVTYREMASRFLKEAEIIAMTNHPNIVRLYGQGAWEQGLYIAMEFIQGISLRQFIQQKSLSQQRALEIVLQVAYALCHLHTHGVIHRDLKPENILITESGEIKVIDFGIAQLQGEVEPSRSGKRRMMGTPIYMSPEQKENPLNVSYASDIYSLGIIAYELLLGRLSYGVIHLALLPKGLRAIIEKALKLDAKERYHDIVDFITDVSHYLRESEESPMELPEEILSTIQNACKVLLPNKLPNWPPVEIGMALAQGVSFSGLYLDFLRLSEEALCILVAEPMEKGFGGILHSSTLRGMVRMTTEHTREPQGLLRSLKRLLSEETHRPTFSFSLLVLNPEKDRLQFVSCNASNLWHIPDGNQAARILSTPNGPLGSEPNAPLLETSANWKSGDTLILHSLGASTQPSGLSEHLVLPAQPMAERILDKLKGTSERTASVISVHRLF